MPPPVVILVVEDETLVRMDAVDQLLDFGFDVFEASCADDAVKILEKNPDIDIVFTDVNMPGSMDGLRLAAAVRHRWPPIKIIVTSGHRSIQRDEMPEESRFFGKPYRAKAIAEAVREMMAA